MPSPYHVVYDLASQDSPVWPEVLVGVAFATLIVMALVDLYRLATAPPIPQLGQRPASIKLMTLGVLFVAALVLIASYTVHSRQRTLLGAERSGAAALVEGVVSRFIPTPHGPHKTERFCVEDSCFVYADSLFNGGFNRTSAEGGPIREGVRVRLLHVGGVIVRLEIADSD